MINLKQLLIMVLVVLIGLICINLAFDWYYKLDLLANPCENCLKYNPHYKPCFEKNSKIYINPITGEKLKTIEINLTGIINPTR